MAVSLFVQITLKPGTRDKFVELVTAHRGRVLDREPGCRHFDVLVQDGEDNQVCLYEIYENQAAFDLHVGTDYMAATCTSIDRQTLGTQKTVPPSTEELP